MTIIKISELPVANEPIQNSDLFVIVQGDTTKKVSADKVLRSSVDSIAALKNLTPPEDGTAIEVSGYYAKNDGGGGTFVFNATSNETDNNGTVIAPNSGGGRWIRPQRTSVDIRWFGARAASGFNNAPILNSCFNLAGIASYFVPSGTFEVADTVEILDQIQNRRKLIYGLRGEILSSRITLTNSSVSWVIACREKVDFRYLGISGVNRFVAGSEGLRYRRSETPNDAQDFLNDLDAVVDRCVIQNVETAIHAYGRNLTIQDCILSVIQTGIVIDTENSVGSGAGPCRGFQIQRNRFHTLNTTCIRVNYEDCTLNTITDNFADGPATFYVGPLNDSVLNDNLCVQLNDKNAFEIGKAQNFTISSNFAGGISAATPMRDGLVFTESNAAKKPAGGTIVGNTFSNCRRGVVLSAGAQSCVFSTNVFYNFAVLSDVFPGMELDAPAVADGFIRDCAVTNNTFFVPSTATNRIAIRSTRTNSQNNVYGSNTFTNITAANQVVITARNLSLYTVADVRYTGSATYNPPNLIDGDGDTTTVSVTGAELGDFVQVSFSLDLQGITMTGWVSSANTVSVRFQNETGGTIDLSSGTLRAKVIRAGT